MKRPINLRPENASCWSIQPSHVRVGWYGANQYLHMLPRGNETDMLYPKAKPVAHDPKLFDVDELILIGSSNG